MKIQDLLTEQELDEIIRKVNGGYRLYSHNGKNLGTYPSKGGAEKRERQVQYFKHMDESPADSVKDALVYFFNKNVGDVHKEKLDDYNQEARKLLSQAEQKGVADEVKAALVKAKSNPYLQGGVVTTIGAVLTGGLLAAANKYGLTPGQTNLLLQAVLNTVIPTVVSKVNGRSWEETAKYTLASASVGMAAAGMMEAQSAKSGIVQTDVYGTKAYHAKCMEKGCDWESKRYDRITQAQAAAKKHAEQHFDKKDVAEAKMSAAVRLQRAMDRERAKTDASYRAGEEVMARARAEQEKKKEQEKK